MEWLYSIDQIHAIATSFWQAVKTYRVFAMKGAMGAGKTTFVHALCEVWGVKEGVGSPTFSIMNQYTTATGRDVYHMDLYRLKDEEELIAAGVEEALYSEALCLVEWPEKATNLLPPDTVAVELLLVSEKERLLRVRIPG